MAGCTAPGRGVYITGNCSVSAFFNDKPALKISNPSATGTTEGLKINDITLEYRMLKKRVS